MIKNRSNIKGSVFILNNFLNIKNTLVAVLILIILFFVYVFYDKSIRPNKINQLSPTPTKVNIDSNSIDSDLYQEIKKEFQKNQNNNVRVNEINNLSIWWITEDGLNITNDNSPGIELENYRCDADSYSNQNFKELIGLLALQIDGIMHKNGYLKSNVNSSLSIDDKRFYDYIQAYEKGSVKAVFTANPDCESVSNASLLHNTISFGLTDKLEQNYQLQSPYLKNFGINDAVVRVSKKVGEFIYLNINYRRAGDYLIAKLIDNKWKKIFSGQDVPLCEIVQKYSIPKEIVDSCISNGSRN